MAKTVKKYRLKKEHLDQLLDALSSGGDLTVAPLERDGTVMWESVDSADALPWNRREDQKPGHYRLKDVKSGRCFDVTHGPQSLKPLSFAPREQLTTIRRDLDLNIDDKFSTPFEQDFVVHCPELFRHDELCGFGARFSDKARDLGDTAAQRGRRCRLAICLVVCRRALRKTGCEWRCSIIGKYSSDRTLEALGSRTHFGHNMYVFALDGVQ